jgi:WD40 repeat protein
MKANSLSSTKNFKIHINKNIIESNWPSPIKSFKILDNILCLCECSKLSNCLLITFNKNTNLCKCYRSYLTNQNLVDSNGNNIYYVDKQTFDFKGIEFKRISTGSQVYSLAQSSNGDLVCGCFDGIIRIYSTTSWNLISTITHTSNSPVNALTFQNGYLVSGADDAMIKIWDLSTGTLIRTLSQHNQPISALIVLSNGDLVSASYDYKAIIWNKYDWNLKYIHSVVILI